MTSLVPFSCKDSGVFAQKTFWFLHGFVVVGLGTRRRRHRPAGMKMLLQQLTATKSLPQSERGFRIVPMNSSMINAPAAYAGTDAAMPVAAIRPCAAKKCGLSGSQMGAWRAAGGCDSAPDCTRRKIGLHEHGPRKVRAGRGSRFGARTPPSESRLPSRRPSIVDPSVSAPASHHPLSSTAPRNHTP